MGRCVSKLLAKEAKGKRGVEQLSWFLSCPCAGALLLLVARGQICGVVVGGGLGGAYEYVSWLWMMWRAWSTGAKGRRERHRRRARLCLLLLRAFVCRGYAGAWLRVCGVVEGCICTGEVAHELCDSSDRTRSRQARTKTGAQAGCLS
jgi:hypothetical protein